MQSFIYSTNACWEPKALGTNYTQPHLLTSSVIQTLSEHQPHATHWWTVWTHWLINWPVQQIIHYSPNTRRLWCSRYYPGSGDRIMSKQRYRSHKMHILIDWLMKMHNMSRGKVLWRQPSAKCREGMCCDRDSTVRTDRKMGAYREDNEGRMVLRRKWRRWSHQAAKAWNVSRNSRWPG